MKLKNFSVGNLPRIALLFLVGITALSATAKLYLAIMSSSFAFTSNLPRCHIESWTYGAFNALKWGEPFYKAQSLYSSPIYLKLPYEVNYWGASLIQWMTGGELISANRVLNVVYLLASLITMIYTLFSLTRKLVLSILVSLSIFPALMGLFHTGFAFPHEMTKFFLVILFCTSIYSLISGKKQTALIFALICIAPFVRQTYLFISLYLFVVLILPEFKPFRRSFITFRLWAPGVALALYGVFELFHGSELRNVLFWVLELPSHHPRSVALIPPLASQLTLQYALFGLGAVFIVRRQINRSRALAGLVLIGAFVCWFHSRKQGSGHHMADTIVFPATLLVAYAFIETLKHKTKWAIIPIIILFGMIYESNKTNGNLYSPNKLISSVRSVHDDHDALVAALAKTGEALKNLKETEVLYGPIEPLANLTAGPLLTSIIDTSYSVPRFDGAFWQSLKTNPLKRYLLSEDDLAFFHQSANEIAHCTTSTITTYPRSNLALVEVTGCK